MNSILRIYIPSTLNAVAQHTEVLIMTLDLTPDISKQPTLYDQVHYSLRIKRFLVTLFKFCRNTCG